MTEPTKKQIEAWCRDAELFASELGAGSGWAAAYDAQLCQLAAAWAREQALEKAAKVADATVCDTHIFTGIKIYGRKVGDAIRALKEPSNG